MANIRNGNLDLYVKQLLSEALDNDINGNHRPSGNDDKNGSYLGPVSKPDSSKTRQLHN